MHDSSNDVQSWDSFTIRGGTNPFLSENMVQHVILFTVQRVYISVHFDARNELLTIGKCDLMLMILPIIKQEAKLDSVASL